MKYLIKGITEVIKLCIILYAVYIAFECGIIDSIVNIFK